MRTLILLAFCLLPLTTSAQVKPSLYVGIGLGKDFLTVGDRTANHLDLVDTREFNWYLALDVRFSYIRSVEMDTASIIYDMD